MKAVTESDGKLKLQLRTMQEIRSSMNVRMETDDDPSFNQDEIIDNLLHLYQTELSLKELDLKLHFKKEQESKEIEISQKYGDESDRTVNFFFAIKQFNRGKIDSHLYFFRGFCQEINPELCLMLDIGTEVKPQSLNKLVELMDTQQNLGGCCGDLEVDLDSLDSCFNLLAYAQYYEYKLSHYIDKAFEGCFSYQSVLPGAFSVLRWEAISGKPVEEFLKGINKKGMGLLQLNMFLAEDRIMCFQIISQKSRNNKSYELMYLPGARAVTDPPTSLLKLMQQRRRWINGANAIFLYVVLQCTAFTQTEHTCL